MYIFFGENNQINGNLITITGEDYNHIANVLRMKKEEKILISNKHTSETYTCYINQINKNDIICTIIEKNDTSTEMNIKVDVYQGLPKADKMEYIIQKSVELGVNKIIPINMKYCIAKIKDEEKKNIRWNKISEVAAKQSKRNIIPKVEMSIDINKACEELKKYDLVLVAYENEENATIKEALQNDKEVKSIAVIIGPEGGISNDEIEKLKEIGAKIVTLGKRILRTETASIVLLSMITYEYEL